MSVKTSTKQLVLSAIAITAMTLVGCSSAPKQQQSDAAPSDQPLPSIEGVPAGLDISAPDTNPYLAQEVDIPGAARSLFGQATDAMRKKDWRKAEVVLQQLTTEYPNLSGPLLNLGIVYRALDNYSDAETALNNAVKANNLNVDAHNQLGLILREQGRFKDAEQAYQNAIKAWPKHAASHKNIGILYDLYLGQPQKALQHFEIYQYLQAEPNREIAGWIIELRRRVGG